MNSDASTKSEPWRILVICTANVCRSPVVERLLQQHLTNAGRSAIVTSAGTHGGNLDPHPDTIRAASTVGIDITDHQSRLLTGDLLATDGRDLVITMTREHLRDTVGIDPGVWPRTFTLRELARRALNAPSDSSNLTTWCRYAADGRRAADLMHPSPDDDVDDPYGRHYDHHLAMVSAVDQLTLSLSRLLPQN